VQFLEQVRAAWGLDEPLAELALRWAARLHEIGLDVAHNGYHRHGAYLLDNADMPGFGREEQFLVARLVGNHRRKLALEHLEDLIPPWDRLAIYLIVVLRLAVLLHRSRGPAALAPIELNARGRTLEVHFPQRWLREHPLSEADLQLEVDYLRAQGLRLRVFERGRGGS
jgi:exopolyphosphatase/guanosine-5'-triphosphate,3'-diphosphate pyrophosphatase